MNSNDSRVEKILSNIISGQGTSNLEPPQSRVEWLLIMLNNIVDQMDDINLFHICEQGEYDPIFLTPTIQNPENNLFYLVPSPVGNDRYAEWIYTNNGEWEKFGNVENVVIDDSLSIEGAAADAAEVGKLKNILNQKQDALTFDSTPTENSSNPVTSDGVYDALSNKQDTLTFDSTPTENSSNPVTSDGVYDALSNKQDALTFDSTPTENSSNPVTSDGVYDALSNKQDTLTFDSTPTENSSNPVTSDGVYDALSNKQDALTFDSTPTENSSNPVTSDGVYDALSLKENLSNKVVSITNASTNTQYPSAAAVWALFNSITNADAINY